MPTKRWFQTWIATTAVALTLGTAGCSQHESQVALTTPTLPPPTPAGMSTLPPRPPLPPDSNDNECDPTASLRPFASKAEADEAVRAIRARGRLIVGLDIGTNLFSFRDPITGGIIGFDVDIAGEIAHDIFGDKSQVEYRILSPDERIPALQKSTVDIVVNTMTITCERRKFVNFSTVYLNTHQRIMTPRNSAITKPSDLGGNRVCVTQDSTSMHRVQQISPPPIIVTVLNWSDCLVALQQHEIDAISTDDSILAGLMQQDPYLHIVGPEIADQPYGIAIKLEDTGLVRFVNGTLERIRHDGTWNTLYRKWLTVLGPPPALPTPKYVD